MSIRIINAALVAMVALGCVSSFGTAQADVRVSASMVFDSRHGHNHYYPAPGVMVRSVPRDAYIAHYRGAPYYFRGGVWYRPVGPRFVVARPPIGTVITVLPSAYTTVWFGGVSYYYADYVYYRWDPAASGYVVSAPPDGSAYEADASPPMSSTSSGDVFVYPKQGQSDEQQATDRYECHRWAADQSGFDPTKAQGGVATGEVNGKRADYQRAQAACLEARGYTVK